MCLEIELTADVVHSGNHPAQGGPGHQCAPRVRNCALSLRSQFHAQRATEEAKLCLCYMDQLDVIEVVSVIKTALKAKLERAGFRGWLRTSTTLTYMWAACGCRRERGRSWLYGDHRDIGAMTECFDVMTMSAGQNSEHMLVV